LPVFFDILFRILSYLFYVRYLKGARGYFNDKY
jgi:hypothetical protein